MMELEAELSSMELKRRLDAGERCVLLDVREPFERELCVIRAPNANDLPIPLGQLADRVAEVLALRDPVVVYCHHGIRSRMAVEWLRLSQALNNVPNLTGGIDAWSIEVDPQVPRY